MHIFTKVHDLFEKHGKVHTIAVEMKDMWDSKTIFYFIATKTNIKVGLHGWTHRDYSKLSYDECVADIEKSLKYWRDNVSRMITPDVANHKSNVIDTFYPPWNRTSPDLIRACEKCGLKIDARHSVPEVYNFHFWSMTQKSHLEKLEQALVQP